MSPLRAVEVGELGLGDLLKLGATDGANTALRGLTGTLLNSSVESAMRIIEGTARNMGVAVSD